MVKQVDVLHNERQRQKLSIRTGLLLVLFLLLPFLLPAGTPKFIEPESLTTIEKPAAPLSQNGEQCYQTTSNIQRDSLLGIRVLDLTYQLNWCTHSGGISTVDVQEITHKALGKWTVEEPTVNVLERTDTSAVVDVNLSVAHESALRNFSEGGSHRYTLHTDGTAELGG